MAVAGLVFVIGRIFVRVEHPQTYHIFTWAGILFVALVLIGWMGGRARSWPATLVGVIAILMASTGATLLFNPERQVRFRSFHLLAAIAFYAIVVLVSYRDAARRNTKRRQST